MRRFFGATFLTIFMTTQAFAEVVFYSLLPNPAGDDTLREYIEIRNTGCSDINIAGYELRDLQKGYIFPDPTLVLAHSNLSIAYSTSKIALNNTGVETLTLKNPNGDIIDIYSYSGTQKDDIVLSVLTKNIDCTQGTYPPPLEEGISSSEVFDTGSLASSGSEMSGSLLTPLEGSGSSSGSELFTESGIFLTGSLSGSLVREESMSSTGSSMSGGETPQIPLAGTGGESIYSGALSNTGEIMIPIETGSLVPLEMYYSDTDQNKKIDTLEVIYPYALTGVVHTGAISLYSNTGGISSSRINTLTGYVLSGSLSGNTLILKIQEGDIVKTSLKITNTTTSDLRLKSSADLGFRSLGGKMPEDFFLTSSFESYARVFPKGGSIGASLDSTETISSEVPGSMTGTHTEILFPEIIPTLQSPTNMSLSGEIFTCTSSECRINLTLEPLFSSGFAMKDYVCSFGTGEFLTADTDCNPNTFYYTSSGVLIIEIASKNNPLNHIRKSYTVFRNYSSYTSSNAPASPPVGIPDTGRPVALIEIDGKWKDYYEQIGDYEMNCHTLTCSLNFTAEKSYDPEGSKVRWFWIYGPNEVSDSKDPGTRKYGIGNHSIILRVIDASGNYSEIRYQIHVLGPKPKEEKVKIQKVQKGEKKIKITSSIISSQKKKYKKLKMIFFTEPLLLLQGKSGIKKSEEVYLCEYKRKKSCTMNFSLSGTLKGYTYVWKVDGEEVHRGKNPTSWKLSPGIHSLELQIYRGKESIAIASSRYSVKVVAAPVISKKKATQVKKKSSKKSSIKNIIPEANAESSIQKKSTQENTTGFGLFFFGMSVITLSFLRRRRFSHESKIK